MPYKKLSLWSCLAIAGSVWAQAPLPVTAVVGKSIDVKGLVTVSYGTNAASVVDNTPVVEGSRFVTSSSGSTTLKFDDGCEVKLKPNQALTVDNKKDCEARIAAIQNLSRDGAGFMVGGGGGGGQLVLLGTVFGAAIAAFANGGGAAAALVGGNTPAPPGPGTNPGVLPVQCLSPPCP